MIIYDKVKQGGIPSARSRRYMKKLTAIFSISVILAGCASYTEPHLQALADSSTNYLEFSDFSYQSILPDIKSEYRIEPGSPVFEFETGKSYFWALSIPDSNAKFVNITSKLIGQWIPTSHMFYPIAIFLNEQYEVVSRMQPKLVHNPRYGHGLDFDSQTKIPIGAKLIVLHSIPASYGKTVPLFKGKSGSRMAGIPMAGGGTMFLNTPGLPDSTTVGPSGRMWVEFSDSILKLPPYK